MKLRGLSKVVGNPKLMMGIGLAGFFGAIGLTVVGVIEAQKVHKEYKEEREKLTDKFNAQKDEDGETLPAKKNPATQDFGKLFIKTMAKYVISFAPAAGAAILGTMCVTKSYKTLTARVMGLTAVCGSLKATLDKIHERVVEDAGEAKWQEYRYGIKEKEIEEVDEKGKVSKVKINVAESEKDLDGLIIFDERSDYWEPEPDFPMYFIKLRQQLLTNQLVASGNLFLNEVFDALGLPRTEEGAVTGWVMGEGDEYVDLRPRVIKVKDGIGYHSTIVLDPNHDGVIIDKLERR